MTQQSSSVRRRYLNPPVVEAVARLKFETPIQWSITTPGLLYERVREGYPAQPETRNVMRADLTTSTDAPGAAGATNVAFSAGPQEMVFVNDDRTRLLIVGPEAISVHSLPPYEGWENLEERLFKNLRELEEIISPGTRFSEVSVRYINQVEIAKIGINLTDYMTIGFQLPEAFPQQLTGFLDRVEVVYPDAPAKLSFTWASTQAPDSHSAFVLDLDLSASPEDTMDFTEARSMLNVLKSHETDAFEGLIKDSLREQFGEIR